MSKKASNEMRSVNPDKTLYSEFSLEELENRLEMAAWLCGVDCPQADCGIDGVECGVDGDETIQPSDDTQQ